MNPFRFPLATTVFFAAASVFGLSPAPDSTARFIPLAGDARCATDPLAPPTRSTALVTVGRTQYAAFFGADGSLVVARRAIGSDVWQTRRTAHRVPADAAATVAVAVDGTGHLHVAWSPAGGPLAFCRSTEPDNLELGPVESLAGGDGLAKDEPSLLRLPNGGLLRLHRRGDGTAGTYELSRYDTTSGRWTTVQPGLLGNVQRPGAVTTCVDPKGNLHLAWIGRAASGDASTAAMAYARSADGGSTWTTADGKPLSLPLAADNADFAVRLPGGRALLSSPVVAADQGGNPSLVGCWAAEGNDPAQFHVARHTKKGWSVQAVAGLTPPATPSSAPTPGLLVTGRNWNRAPEGYLFFRDEGRGGRAVVAACRDLDAKPQVWTRSDLTAGPIGGWVPVFDTDQWMRLFQGQVLVHAPSRAAAVANPPAATIASLVWSPFLAGLAEDQAKHPSDAGLMPAAGVLDRPLDPQAILPLLERVTDWQLAQPYKRDPRGWEIAPFYIGGLEVAKLSSSPRFSEAFVQRFEKMEWKPAPRDYHADDYCVVQAYLELYRRDRDPRRLTPSCDLFDRILKAPAPAIDWGRPGATNRWTWCDALFMGPASWLDVFNATGDRRYLDFMNAEWWRTTALLHVPADRWYARDESFLDLHEPNGRRLYWSRGNGWVAAGLARVLDRFPKDHADHPRYLALYHDMMIAVLDAQQPDGLWRPGLLDPVAHPAQEASGSSFFTFALAWGINRGLLDRSRTEPAVRRAWNALTAFVTSEGKLERVQPIGAQPDSFNPAHTDAFGVGAFLLAGSEVHRLAATHP